MTETRPPGVDREAMNSPLIEEYTFSQLREGENESLLASLDAACGEAFEFDYGQSGLEENYSQRINKQDGQGRVFDGVVKVIREEGEVIGAGMIAYHREGGLGEDTEPSQELSHVFVASTRRREGHGTAITASLLQHCVDREGNIWAELMRGQGQLDMHRRMVEEIALAEGKEVTDWRDDPTTESYAYAYQEQSDGSVYLIFQGRVPNGNADVKWIEIKARDPFLSPDRLLRSGDLTDFTVRIDWGGLSKSVGITKAEFEDLQELVRRRHGKLTEEMGAGGEEPLKIFSVTVAPKPHRKSEVESVRAIPANTVYLPSVQASGYHSGPTIGELPFRQGPSETIQTPTTPPPTPTPTPPPEIG